MERLLSIAERVIELINRCLYVRDSKCQFCVNNCPTGALTLQGLDKHRCYAHLLEVGKQFLDLGLCDICGKCAVGPCAQFSNEE